MADYSVNGITAAKGFLAAGIHCGIKREKRDLALVVSEFPAVCAGVFTRNKVAAACVDVDKFQMTASPYVRAIVVNSGNANACTGAQGLADAWEMVDAVAGAMNIDRNEVFVSSTGVIGRTLPMEKLRAGIAAIVPIVSSEGHEAAADAILTTDTFSKEYAVQVMVQGAEVWIGGMSKGSGMIAPNMATMLAFITTDAAISSSLLQTAVKRATDLSFNRITVDGDTSTNDMAIVMANGAAHNSELTSIDDPGYREFFDGLVEVFVKLSKLIVLDGEGATKFIEVCVKNAATEAAAEIAARSIANSNLVKTAIHGEDANWGRILAAAGYSGIDFDPARTEIFFGDVPILRQNYGIDFSEEAALGVLKKKEITITVDLHQGDQSAVFWTCDLSKEYITINANYRT
ncbi:MAG: bifunctional glutamate N-acetyltransferase/amino-acid acetyltransferase ArgJ [Ignavibacteriales bacterium]|nr:bifunctional glutamate N-acetyltransferase/amino-acid acetyltransferase ArgJ [Ignavibacteriales bacterium]